ncbi:hypothetical protein CYY_006746 [Polysphondylium violaceum]|uniref:Ferrochelatase n=1 Tax=Polysphondylium violaceum TaxID=133409 RepID=A0A8J4PRS3_9MYCE|nr:hypothetical protein CYY_006746 [Polysphondylium violaceum]
MLSNRIYRYISSNSISNNNNNSKLIIQYFTTVTANLNLTDNNNNDIKEKQQHKVSQKQKTKTIEIVDEEKKKVKTAILMLNLGGPETLDDVEPFLTRLFSDRDIFKLPFQNIAGPLIAKRRSFAVKKLYASIGGGSPIKKWTDLQGKKITDILDTISPETAPHKHYIGFRYSDPLIDDALKSMKEDQVERVVAFSQYPQYSCTTTGSSLNNLWKAIDSSNMEKEFKWSIIDRWNKDTGFINATKTMVQRAIENYNKQVEEKGLQYKKPVLVFSAHSLPMATVEKGDPYPQEIAETVGKVMEGLGNCVKDGKPFQYILAWQSKVGPLPWLSPKTTVVIEKLAKENNNAIVIPIAFTSDHIETLSEIDIELQHTAKEAGMDLLIRSNALNDDPLIIDAMAQLVDRHLKSNKSIESTQYHLRCPGCKGDEYCRTIRNPILDDK